VTRSPAGMTVREQGIMRLIQRAGIVTAVAIGGLAPAAAGAATGGAVPAARAAVPAAGSWGRAIEVPGLAALNKGDAVVNSVSCGSAGNCAAVGYYTDRRGQSQGFVASERHGRWGKAIEVPGLAALGGGSGVSSVSCASAGNCAAGGGYTDRHRHELDFVVSEKNGRWGTAIEVPGLGALNKGRAELFEVSCGSAGNCAAGGGYTDSSGHGQGFVVSEKNGSWGMAIEVPGLAALNKGGDVLVWSVSCGSAGSCAVGGSYTDRRGQHGFVADERHGVWGKAIEVPGLNAGTSAGVLSVSCPSAGNCAAGGFYGTQGFVAVERNGVWGKAIEVPGLAALNAGEAAYVESVSCASAGSCAAVGTYALDSNPYYADTQGFVAVEKNGRWGRAIVVPGLKALNAGRNAYVNSVSCASAGNCAVGGQYSDRNETYRAFVAVERNGVWGKAIEVPGLGTLETSGNGDVFSVSCGSAGDCTAGGTYGGSHGYQHGFVT